MEHALLLVDDEPVLLKALERLFEDEGYQILTASSGNEALQKWDSKRVSLVISDYEMPLMNGVELLQEIKARAPHTVRIMLTGYADMDATIESINKSEVHRYVRKPWNNEELKFIVRDCLRQYETAEENKRLTELIKIQNQELTSLNQNLEKKVQERTREIKIRNRELKELCTQLGERNEELKLQTQRHLRPAD